MKRHLFYTFLGIFSATSIVTILGVTSVISIAPDNLSLLLKAFIVALGGAMVALFRKTDFFAEDEHAKEIQKLKRAYENYTVELEGKYTSLVKQQAQEDSYIPDPKWPGTATKIDNPGLRVCHNCLLLTHKALPVIYDSDNKRWGCGNCKVQLNPLP